MLWHYECASTIADIWRYRHHVITGNPDSDFEITARKAVTTRRGHAHLRQLILQHSDNDQVEAVEKAISSVITALRPAPVPSYAEPPLHNHLILFFDGGPRENPGPGGSGSVLIQLGSEPASTKLMWIASMAYGSGKTTNNYAEYKGLLHGLRYALSHGCRPLHVVGDSSMIIRQHQTWRSPNKAPLAAMYRQTARLAMLIGIKTWSHHYRNFGKMVNAVTNRAMDRKASQQQAYTGTAADDAVIRYLTNNVDHWLDNHAIRA